MSDDRTIGEYLDELRDNIQVKLMRLARVGNPDTLQLICLAIGMRVADPYNIADAQEDPAWHASIQEGKQQGEIPADQDPLEVIAQTILLLFVGFDDEAPARDPERQKQGED